MLDLYAASLDIAGFHGVDCAVEIAGQDIVEHDDQFNRVGVAYRCFLIRHLGPIGIHLLALSSGLTYPLFEFEFEFPLKFSSELICCCSNGSWRNARSTWVYCW